MSKIQMKVVISILILVLLAATGCVSKQQDEEHARAAYLAGQKAAYESMGHTMLEITVLGDVKQHQIPWKDGLTLAKAIAMANYTGTNDPTQIVLKRNSVQTSVDPKDLLNGRDMTLQSGDTIVIIGQ